jgi:hypothetical protein
LKAMSLGAIPAMSCPATWPPLAAHPAVECTKPDGGLVSSSDRNAVIAFLMLSQDELDLRAQRWVSADTWELCRVGLTTHLRPWPFDVVWDEVRDRESGAVDGQFSQLRKAAGSRLNEVGLTRQPKGSAGPGRVDDRVAAAVRHTKW